MQPAEPQARRVLVVDDNQAVARSLLNLLKSEGLDPMVFQSGQPALEYLKKTAPTPP
jgi:CheY-like chemotaxis protein